MKFLPIEITNEALQQQSIAQKYAYLESILKQLDLKPLQATSIEFVNTEIKNINNNKSSTKTYFKQIQKSTNKILFEIEKREKLVIPNHYRNFWLVIGMSAFGLPLGLCFALALKNMAFLGIGLPIGLGIGAAIGTQLDQKAKAEGRQLEL